MYLQHPEHTTPMLEGQANADSLINDNLDDQTPSERFYSLLGNPIGIGLPGEPLNLKQNWSIEDVFMIVYTIVDDTYKKLFIDSSYFRRSNNSNPVFTDAELITIALVAELIGYESQNAWWEMLNKNYRYLFPYLCHRSRYNRRLNKMQPAIEQLRQHVTFLTNADVSQLRVVDSFPISLCHLRRVSSSSEPFAYFATCGYCAAKKEFFYGLRMHLMTDSQGIILGYGLSAGHVHDTKGFVFLLSDLNQVDPLFHRLFTLLGDKGYTGEKLAQQIKAELGITLLAMERKYHPEYGATAYNEAVGKARKIIETNISVLTGVMHAAKTFTRSLKGLVTSLTAKITALTIGNYLNLLIRQPVLQISSIVN